MSELGVVFTVDSHRLAAKFVPMRVRKGNIQRYKRIARAYTGGMTMPEVANRFGTTDLAPFPESGIESLGIMAHSDSRRCSRA